MRKEVEATVTQTNFGLVLMRDIAIFCIVLHHTFNSFGGWPPDVHTYGLELPPLFWRACSFTKTLGMSAFTFMAGFCAVKSLSRYGRISFILRKIDRLLVPCGFWGVLYWWMFPTMMLQNSPVNGSHLWFLPMLFICFVLFAIIPSNRFRFLNAAILWGVFVVIHLLLKRMSLYEDLTFRSVQELVVYFPVFLFGSFFAYLETCDEMFRRRRNFIKCAGVCLCLVLSLLLNKIYAPLSYCLWMMFLSGLSFMAVAPFGDGKSNDGHTWIRLGCLSLNYCSFGIYILHQFILNAILLALRDIHLAVVVEFLLLFLGSFLGSWGIAYIWLVSRRQLNAGR